MKPLLILASLKMSLWILGTQSCKDYSQTSIIVTMKQVWYAPNTPIGSPDSIHQTLMYGSLQDIQALKANLGSDRVREAFLKYPKKIYTKSAFFFVKKFILEIPAQLDEQYYLKTTPRNIR